MTNTEAFATANRKSKATHRNWLVWPRGGDKSAGDHWHAEEIGVDAIKRAMSDVREQPRRVTLVTHRKPYYYYIGPALAAPYIANLEAGYYSH